MAGMPQTVDVPVALTLTLSEPEPSMNNSPQPFWKQPAIYITAMIMPLIYYVTYAVMNGVGGQQMQTMVITAIISGALGTIGGFWLGSSQGSGKKDDALAAAASTPADPGAKP